MICIKCLDEESLIKNLKSVIEKGECSFCSNQGEVICAENFFEELSEAITSDGWVRAIDEGSYDSDEGDYYQKTIDLRELAVDFCQEVGINNEKLLSYIRSCFLDEWMIDKPYGEDYHDDYFIKNWETFKINIKNKWRYTLLLSEEPFVKDFKNMMCYLGDKCIIKTKLNDCFFRGRAFTEEKIDLDVLQYGPPEIHFTKNSRMSPKGIVYLYCSSSEQAVIEEINAKNIKTIGIIEFRPKNDLKIVDLSELIMPSSFDKEHRIYRRALDFLNGFIEEISKPIEIDDEEHLEYMATQVICEYLRYYFINKGITGLKYKSSKIDAENNFVFFCDSKNFLEYFEIISKIPKKSF